MTTSEVARRLVVLCRNGNWEKAQRELYHPEIISKEPEETGGKTTKGLEAIFEKNKYWSELAEKVHDWSVSDPLIADGYFCCTMMNDVTIKGMGRIQSTELCVYKVENGKITMEQFFHT